MRLDGNDYSVHPAVIGRRIEVVADLVGVRVHCDGQLVADHRRLWAKHQTVSAPEHGAATRALRQRQRGASDELLPEAAPATPGQVPARTAPRRMPGHRGA